MKEFFMNLYVKLCVMKTKTIVSVEHKIGNLSDEEKKIYKQCFGVMFVACALLSVALFAPSFYASYTIDVSGTLNEYKTMFNEIYPVAAASASIIAVTLVAYNLIVIMTSKNQKKCDTAYTWIKAVAITWLCFMLVSVVIKIAVEFFNEGVAESSGKLGL